MHLRPARLRQPGRILPANPLKEVLLHQHILWTTRSAEPLDAAVPEDVMADTVKTHRLRRACRRPVDVTDVESHAIGPLKRIVFKDEMVAVIRLHQHSLGVAVTVPGMPELDATHA